MPLALSVTEQIDEYGAYAGFAAILGLAVLSLLYFAQARELKRLREWAGRAPERLAELEAAQAARGVVAQPRTPAAATTPAGRAVPPRPPAPAATPAGQQAAVATPNGAPAKPGEPATAAAAAAAKAGAAPAPATPGSPAATPATPGAAPTPGAPGAPATAAAAGGAAAPPKPPAPGQPAAPGQAPAPAGDAPKPPAPGEAPKAPAADGGQETVAAPPVAPGPPKPAQPLRAPVPSATPPSGVRRAGAPSPAPAPSARQAERRAEPQHTTRNTVAFVAAGIVLLIAVVFVGSQVLGGDEEPAGNTTPATQSEPSAAVAPGDEGQATSTTTTPAVNRADVTVAVLNGTTTTGLARSVADRVERSEFQIGTVTNAADQSRSATIVQYAPGQRAAAREVAKAIGVRNDAVQPLDEGNRVLASDAAVVVVVGADQNTETTTP